MKRWMILTVIVVSVIGAFAYLFIDHYLCFPCGNEMALYRFPPPTATPDRPLLVGSGRVIVDTMRERHVNVSIFAAQTVEEATLLFDTCRGWDGDLDLKADPLRIGMLDVNTTTTHTARLKAPPDATDSYTCIARVIDAEGEALIYGSFALNIRTD